MIFLRVAFCIVLLSTSLSAASGGFPATRYPFQPELLVNNNPGLCALQLGNAKRQFFGQRIETGVEPRVKNRDGMEWLEWEQPTSLQAERNHLGRLDLDLDGTGKKQVVLMHFFEHSWRGNNYRAFVLLDTAALRKLQQPSLNSMFEKLMSIADSRSTVTVSKDVVQYYPGATLTDSAGKSSEIGVGSDWQSNQLFRWKGRYYFQDDVNDFGQVTQSEHSTYRLRADGKVDLQCRIKTIPDHEAVESLLAVPSFASFHHVISTIGEGGEDGGTLHSGYSHNYNANAATARISYRPWTVSRVVSGDAYGSERHYYQYDERLMQFLEDWSYQDGWSRREFLTLQQHIAPAKAAMKDYLSRKFGLSEQQAAKHAPRIIDEVIGNWILVPNYYDHQTDLYSVEYHPLAKALLERDPGAQQLIAQFKPRKYSQDKLEQFLMDAVEWPRALEWMLQVGVNPNTVQGYGKTALMMAAHMNRPDTVRTLILHGANPNLVTKGLQRDGRTAMMYAAENAGPQVMALLLGAGADPMAKDNQGNGLDFYMRMNPRFSEQEKLMDVRTLVKERKNHPLPAAFDCRKATDRVEKLICQNEMLMMYESEMSDAYFRLIKHTGSEAQADQKRWLKMRKKSCADGDAERQTGCLQSMAQARERYLHNRLVEYGPKL